MGSRVLTLEQTRLLPMGVILRIGKMKIQAFAMIVIILIISQTMSAPPSFRRFGSIFDYRRPSLNRAYLRSSKTFGRVGTRFRRAIYTHLKTNEKLRIFLK